MLVEPRRREPAGGGADADADDDQVGGDPLAGVELDGLNGGPADHATDFRAETEADAVALVQGAEVRTDLWAEHAGERRAF